MNVSLSFGMRPAVEPGAFRPVRDHAHDRAGASPATLGQRLQDMVRNGAITQGQYEGILAGASSLAPERVQDIKAAYDRGDVAKALDLLNGLGHRKGTPGAAGALDTLA